MDFPALLRQQGILPPLESGVGFAAARPAHEIEQTESTTILAFKFAEGVLVAGDRRATAGNVVVYDQADKVLEIDRYSLMAIAGVPATAWEMARVLGHSFQFHRRSQLQEMSLDGKVRALSRLLRENLSFVLQGVGVVVPIFATYDPIGEAARLYFYDAMGAQFEAADYSATGSGSPAVRALLFYENTWGSEKLRDRGRDESLVLALRALETAAESDAATGGLDRRGKTFPIVRIVSKQGVTTVDPGELAEICKARVG